MDRKQTREYNKLIKMGWNTDTARRFVLDLSDDEQVINQTAVEVQKMEIQEEQHEEPKEVVQPTKMVRVWRPICNNLPPFLYVVEK